MFRLPEYISMCMKAFAAHNWSRELQWQITLIIQHFCNECSFPHTAKWDDGWKTGLDVQNRKIYSRSLVASGSQSHLPLWPVPDCFMGNSKGWAQDTLGVSIRKPSEKGTRNLATELEGIFQRDETTERKFIVRKRCQGQSWMDRALGTDTGEGGGATRWGVHHGPSRGQQCPGTPQRDKLSLLGVPQREEVGGSSSATSFAPSSSNQSPHLAASCPERPRWQWATLSGGTMEGWAQVQWPSQVQLRSPVLDWGNWAGCKEVISKGRGPNSASSNRQKSWNKTQLINHVSVTKCI